MVRRLFSAAALLLLVSSAPAQGGSIPPAASSSPSRWAWSTQPSQLTTFLSFCDGNDFSLSSCPCANPGDIDTGCDIAQGTGGALLAVTGQNTIAMTASMTVSGFPLKANPTVIIVRGNNMEQTPVPFGDGLRCVGVLGFTRLAATIASGGTSTHDFGHGTGPGIFLYQAWFRNAPVSFCVTTGPFNGAFNLSNGNVLVW